MKKVVLTIHSATSYLLSLSIHLMVYEEQDWLFASWRNGGRPVVLGSDAWKTMSPEASATVSEVYGHLEKYYSGKFFSSEQIQPEPLWPLIQICGKTSIEIHGHDRRYLVYHRKPKKCEP